MPKKLVLTVAALGTLFLFACQVANQNPNTPVITASATTVEPGTVVNLTVTCTDPDGDALTFTWCADGGTFSATTGTAVDWTAPNVIDTTVYTVRVIADDANGGVAYGSIEITVAPGAMYVIIGNGDITNWVPFWGGPHDSCRAQYLYYDSEMTYQGTIDAIALKLATPAAGDYYDFEIYICPTTKDTLEATWDNNYGGTPVLVYSRATQTYGRDGEKDFWHDFELDTGYDYTGGNFIVEFRWAGDDGNSIQSYANRTGEVYREIWGFKPGNPTGQPHQQNMQIRFRFEE